MKRRSLKLLSLTMAGALMVGSFIGCSPQKSNDKKLGMVLSTLNNPFFVSMKEGAEKKAKEMGYELVVLDSQNDSTKERSNVEDLVQQGVTALMINPTDSDAVKNSIQVANDSKIPVITLDRESNGGEVVCHISSDNVKGGNMAAEYMLETLKDKETIKVVELQGVPGASATRDRGKGFNDGIAGKNNVKVVASQSAEFDRQKGLSVMENIIQATPDFDVVFAHNDEMALGAVKALKAANKNVIVIGFDGNVDAETAVNAGEMTATIAQQPSLMGELAVEQAGKILNGETVEKQVPADLKVLKK
ncbi:MULTISPECIES: ribose ABC transporter substrate-binding protein RbsB [Clostridium]|uniref:Ribose ABC transporter substrate-binding protein RbsB n=1 Tax=Clostridium aquiflavi TaxID=3073603 RepID=A0ABU1EC72_9CLOT|nr:MULTISPECIES: ribose ABC transporter substrate-binding protein RbsB [unclassified Clostridium]MDR5585922.1 ribose ABC transporter substrate-binding protein RbsB [Clostridium sp. 5N-1]NFG60922.1 ribose ABC transporter substrate-binding protein RbsB [Clostridium botulinum]NFQ09493.1 ribose ABC transporter substrate-binding protein RbsB [Clostridium botulinum]